MSTRIIPGVEVYRCLPCGTFQIKDDDQVIPGGDDAKDRIWARWNEIFDERQFKALLESEIEDPRWERLG